MMLFVYKFSWMLFVFITCKFKSFIADMNPSNQTPSFLKFLNEYDFIFLVCFFYFLLLLGLCINF
ncbi:hypothetical protein Hanom_Chr05g00410951 [Helianthus anomalus]